MQRLDTVHGIGLDGDEREHRQESAQHLCPFDQTGQTTPTSAPPHLSRVFQGRTTGVTLLIHVHL